MNDEVYIAKEINLYKEMNQINDKTGIPIKKI